MAILTTQSVLEVALSNLVQVNVSQATAETLYNGYTPGVVTVRTSQAVLEVLCSLEQVNGFVSLVSVSYPGLLT